MISLKGKNFVILVKGGIGKQIMMTTFLHWLPLAGFLEKDENGEIWTCPLGGPCSKWTKMEIKNRLDNFFEGIEND